MAGRTQNLTMETLEPATPSSSIAAAATSNSQNQSLMPSPLPPSVSRLWRRAAQRKLRNQWSKLAAYRQQWASSSSAGKSHATSLVNAYLDQIETSIGAHVDAFSGVNLEVYFPFSILLGYVWSGQRLLVVELLSIGCEGKVVTGYIVQMSFILENLMISVCATCYLEKRVSQSIQDSRSRNLIYLLCHLTNSQTKMLCRLIKQPGLQR
nr:uncharacterized protein LOC112491685 isoform X2 [Ziziphus jujuba var. spinosa]